MDPSQDVYIYLKAGETDSAYMVKKGRIIIELNDNDSFELAGDNIIFGTAEILLSKTDGYQHFRIFTVKTSPGVAYSRITPVKVEQFISTYNIGFTIAKNIAEILVKVNFILTKKKNEVGEKERLSQEYCKIYTWATDELGYQFEKTRFPWLEKLQTQAKASLTYTKGAAFSSFDRKSKFDISGEQLDEFSKVFPPGANVCVQGEPGDELYILKSGKLKVLINDNYITDIEEPGSIIGEMALLLGETRNATLQSVENTTLTVVKKDNLQQVAISQPDFLRNIAVDLSRRVQVNCTLVNELDEIIQQNKQQDDSLPSALRQDKYKEELKNLKDEIKELYNKHDMDWLYDIVSQVTEKMLEARKI